MVEECRSCSSIHFLFSHYSRDTEQREKDRAARTEHQCTLSSLTTSTGGLGYCEFGVKYFKGVLEESWGWAPWLVQTVFHRD